MSRYTNFSEPQLLDLLAESQMSGWKRRADDIQLELWRRSTARVTLAIDECFRLVVSEPDERRTSEVYEVFKVGAK